MQELLKQIVLVLQSDSTLQTLLGGTLTDKKIYPSINNAFETFPCVVYELISSDENSVPASTQTNTLILKVYCKTNKQDLENIASRINSLLRYYKSDSPKIFWAVKRDQFDSNETDRLLFSKTIRYIIYTKI